MKRNKALFSLLFISTTIPHSLAVENCTDGNCNRSETANLNRSETADEDSSDLAKIPVVLPNAKCICVNYGESGSCLEDSGC